ncbi:hypothetical protein Q4582_04765 [Poseidonibacter sp. 1_MG-2023]|nr:MULTISPECIES: hypothetical protein [Poseidonibacter]MDO6827356.1 hypothetical protein [Poseidonibacter sp. 1_MG-2023]
MKIKIKKLLDTINSNFKEEFILELLSYFRKEINLKREYNAY